MKKQQYLSAMGVGLISLCMAGNANAVFQLRLGGQAYYDTVSDLTWLADANYAQTSGYAGARASGQMTWQVANDWAAGLDVAGVTGWRLADTLQPDASCSIQNSGNSQGLNCTGSELGDLFYNGLGGVANSSITTTHNANFTLFSNVQSNDYWSGTEFAPFTFLAWKFSFNNGNQGAPIKDEFLYAWAVQSGDVSASTVPEPAVVWLLGGGLLGLIGVSRRKSANP